MEQMNEAGQYGASGGDYGAGSGPGLDAGFGRRSTANSSQTSTPSNPGPADSTGAKRYDMGPEKNGSKGSRPAKKQGTKPKKVKAKTRAAPKKT